MANGYGQESICDTVVAGCLRGQKKHNWSLLERIENATKRHPMICHGTIVVCDRKPHVLLHNTTANQQHARDQIVLQGSSGKFAGTMDFVVCLVSKTRNSGGG
jgi:hypothetical protein